MGTPICLHKEDRGLAAIRQLAPCSSKQASHAPEPGSLERRERQGTAERQEGRKAEYDKVQNPVTTLEMHDLERFVAAQDRDFAVALDELRDGQKVSHWIWYVFPQLRSLGHSDRAIYYGIEDISEARAYLEHPILGPRYLTCVRALLRHSARPIESIMGGTLDARKLQSSLTLMMAAGAGNTVQMALDTFFDGKACARTNDILDQG